MNPKIIWTLFNGNDREMGALETSFRLAKRWNAHVSVWMILPDPEEIIMAYAAFGMGFPVLENNFSELLKVNEKNQKLAEEKFLKLAQRSKMPVLKPEGDFEHASASFHVAIGNAGKIVPFRACLSDLIIVACNPEEITSYHEIVTAALFEAGRPVLLVPPGERAVHLDDKTMIAWNGSGEAMRAVNAAFPFLKSGKVWTLTGESDEWKEPAIPPHDLTFYLKAHGIDAETLTPWINHTPLPEAILHSAGKLGADLIVMGAYGHSRMRELIFGGITEYMLRNANTHILMMH